MVKHDPGTDEILPPGTTFGRYTIERHVATGGMAHVYAATHMGLGKRVALKVLQKRMLAVPTVRERFLREGQAAARIRHPHVVDVTDVDVVDDVPFLVMEFLEGETLQERIAQRGAMPVEDTLNIMIPVIAAVAAGHDEGIVHRDLKPANIVLHVDGRRVLPKVLDFGVSHLGARGGRRLTAENSILGTPHYMAPESARGTKDVDPRSDQYSLGVLLYECLTGEVPYDDGSVVALLERIATADFPPPRTHRPDLPADIEAVILRAMSRNRDDRYADVRLLGAALFPFASQRAREFWGMELGHQAPPASFVARADDPPPPAQVHHNTPSEAPTLAFEPRPARRWLIAALLLVGAVAVALYWGSRARRDPETLESTAGPPPTTAGRDGGSEAGSP